MDSMPNFNEAVKHSCCHAERSEASAFIPLKTDKCRFLAPLGMTGLGDFFTASMRAALIAFNGGI
jgi:hypothetical protein